MRMRAVCVFAMLGALGCSGNDTTVGAYGGAPPLSDAEMGRCVDRDGDDWCATEDCDDSSYDLTNLCCADVEDSVVPASTKAGCECQKGLEAIWCDPKEVADVAAVRDGKQGVLKCTEAFRWCSKSEDDGRESLPDAGMPEELYLWDDCMSVATIFEPQ